MPQRDLILYEDDQRRLTRCLGGLCEGARSRAAFLIDRNGRLLAQAGAAGNVDTTTLASLTAGSVAATSGLARLLGEQEFSALVHEGDRESLHVSMIAGEAILVVLFDRQTPLGLVRLRVRQASEELCSAFAAVGSAGSNAAGQELSQITDEDIDNLLSV
ncbi:MAG: roadblock/LC7 domain-containing protein [Candidatus Methylomirabilota bacterium]